MTEEINETMVPTFNTKFEPLNSAFSEEHLKKSAVLAMAREIYVRAISAAIVDIKALPGDLDILAGMTIEAAEAFHQEQQNYWEKV
jgi:hypothetical protein